MIQRCKRCVMDNIADPQVHFTEEGYCNYCTDALNKKNEVYFPNDEGENKLQKLIEEIKRSGKNKKYDCAMGLSGGLDSSYLVYLGYKWGLRILAFHIDDGFDTEVSKSNMEKLISATGFKVCTIEPDKAQYYGLLKAYMLAGVPNLAAPQDNILIGTIYKNLHMHRIRYFLSGENYATECILQRGNTHAAADSVNIKDIFKKFGTGSIDKLQFTSVLKQLIEKKEGYIHRVTPLNYINYNCNQALKELSDFCGFQYYGRKHLENTFTRFVQEYWLPSKFGVDKRKSHLSSMIISTQMTRDEAIHHLEEPLFSENELQKCIETVLDKLSISNDEFDLIMKKDACAHDAYKVFDDTIIGKIIKQTVSIKHKAK